MVTIQSIDFPCEELTWWQGGFPHSSFEPCLFELWELVCESFPYQSRIHGFNSDLNTGHINFSIAPVSWIVFGEHKILNKHLSNKFSWVFANFLPFSWSASPQVWWLINSNSSIQTRYKHFWLLWTCRCHASYFFPPLFPSNIVRTFIIGIVVLLWELFPPPDSELFKLVTISTSFLWNFFHFYSIFYSFLN